MSTMNISLPDSLKSFVDEQVTQRGYGTSSEYVREFRMANVTRLTRIAGIDASGASALTLACHQNQTFIECNVQLISVCLVVPLNAANRS